MSFEIQELPDLIRLIVLLSLKRGDYLTKPQLKTKAEKYLAQDTSIEMSDLDEALHEMASEGLIAEYNEKFTLTSEGIRLSGKWKDLLAREEPILEVVAGVTDGTITGLVVILSAFLAQLSTNLTLWTALLSLAAVAITNFSSFLLGGKTEDLADLSTLKTLMEYSVNDIPDKEERKKSLKIVKHLSSILRGERTRTNLVAASICSVTTFLAGIIPITVFLSFPTPLNLGLSLPIIGLQVVIFLIHYRSERSKVHWKTSLFETLLIIAIAVVASLLLGGW